MDSDEAVDYAGSDADDVISLGGVEEDEQAPSEPEPQKPDSQPGPSVSVSVPAESSTKTTSNTVDQAEPSQPVEPTPATSSREEPNPRQPGSSRASPRDERRHKSSRKGFKDTEDEHGPLPRGWTRKTSKSTGQVYYYNLDTDASAWERPREDTVKPPRESSSSRRGGSKRGDTYRPSPAPAPVDLPPRRESEALAHQSLPPKPRSGASESRRGPPADKAGGAGQELDRLRQERLQALDQSSTSSAEPRRRSAAAPPSRVAANRQGAGPDRGYPPQQPPERTREDVPPVAAAAAPSMYPDRDRSRSYRGPGEQPDRRSRYPSPPPPPPQAVSGYDARRRPRSPLLPPPPHKMAPGSSWSAVAESPAEPVLPPPSSSRDRGYFAGATVLESAPPAPSPPVAAEHDMYASRRRAMADAKAVGPGDTYRPSAAGGASFMPSSHPPPTRRDRERRRKSPSPPLAAPRYSRPADPEPKRDEPFQAAAAAGAPAAPVGVHPSRLKFIQKAHPEPKPQASPRPRSPPAGPRARQTSSSNRTEVPARPNSRDAPPREPAAHRRVSRWGARQESPPEEPAQDARGSSAAALPEQERWGTGQATRAADESWDPPTEPAADRSFETMPRLSTATASQDADAADAQAVRDQEQESPLVQTNDDHPDEPKVTEEAPVDTRSQPRGDPLDSPLPAPVAEEAPVSHQNEERPRDDSAMQDDHQAEVPTAPPAPEPLTQDPLPAGPATTSLGSRIAETRAHEGRNSNGSSRPGKQRGRRRSRSPPPPPRDESTSAPVEQRRFDIAGRAKQEAARAGPDKQPSLMDRMPSTSLPRKPASVEPGPAPSRSLLARLGPGHDDSRPSSPDVASKRARSRSPGHGSGYGPRRGPLPRQEGLEAALPPPRKVRRSGGRRARR